MVRSKSESRIQKNHLLTVLLEYLNMHHTDSNTLITMHFTYVSHFVGDAKVPDWCDVEVMVLVQQHKLPGCWGTTIVQSNCQQLGVMLHQLPRR